MHYGISVKLLLIIITGLGYAEINEKGAVRLVIDTFSTCLSYPERVPCGWYATQKDVHMFFLNEENGNRYLKIKTIGGNTSLGMRFDYDLDTYRYLRWRWRVHRLPTGAREDRRRFSDSAAGVYVVFSGRMRLNRIIKYVWSTSLEQGAVTESPFNRRTKIVVLRCGEGAAGSWVEEVVDVTGDFRRLFGTDPPPVEGIAVMSDSDNTQSDVEADYDDFAVSVDK